MPAARTANDTVSAHGAATVTPSDATVLQNVRALFVGTAGNLNVKTADGQTVLFTNVGAGIFPVQVTQVLATSTTASNIVALY
jgi:hypothetical protein